MSLASESGLMFERTKEILSASLVTFELRMESSQDSKKVSAEEEASSPEKGLKEGVW